MAVSGPPAAAIAQGARYGQGRVRPGPALSQLLALFAAQVLSFAAPVVVLAALARWTSSEEFASAAFGMATGVLLRALVEYGFEFTGLSLLARHDEHSSGRRDLIMNVFVARTYLAGFAALVAVAVVVAQGWSGSSVLAALFAVAVAVGGLNHGWVMIAEGRARTFVVIDSALRCVGVGLGLLLFWRTGHATLLPGALLASTLIAAGLQHQLLGLGWPRALHLRWHSVWSSLSEHRHGLLLRLSVLLYTSGIAVILGVTSSPSELVLFAPAEKLLRAFLTLLMPLSQLAAPGVARAVARDAAEGAAVARKALRATLGFGVVLAVLLGLLGEPLIGLVFGDAYRPSGGYLLALVPCVVVVAVSNALGLQWLLPAGESRLAGRAALAGGLAGGAAAVLLCPREGAWGAVIAMTLAEVVVTAVLAWVCLFGRQRSRLWLRDGSGVRSAAT